MFRNDTAKLQPFIDTVALLLCNGVEVNNSGKCARGDMSKINLKETKLLIKLSKIVAQADFNIILLRIIIMHSVCYDGKA